MKRIAFLIDNLDIGGAQTMLVRLASNINLNKYIFKVFVLRRRIINEIDKEFIDNNIRCIYLNVENDTTISKKIKAYKSLVNELNRFKPDIIHSHLDFFYSLVYCTFNSPRLIITIHGWPNRVIDKKFILIANNWILKKKMVIVGCADVVAVGIRKLLPKIKVASIYNPIVLSKFHYSDKEYKKPFPFIYIHVARLTRIKNQELLIQSFNKLLTICPNSQLWIVGDGDMRDELISLINILGIKDRVKILGQRYDIPDLLAKSDAFVLSSKSECCPMSILEAMASGLPVISTNVGGVHEVVNNAGICVENDNIDALCNGMAKIQLDAALRRMCRKNAIERVKEFDSTIIVQKYEKLYEVM